MAAPSRPGRPPRASSADRLRGLAARAGSARPLGFAPLQQDPPDSDTFDHRLFDRAPSFGRAGSFEGASAVNRTPPDDQAGTVDRGRSLDRTTEVESAPALSTAGWVPDWSASAEGEPPTRRRPRRRHRSREEPSDVVEHSGRGPDRAATRGTNSDLVTDRTTEDWATEDWTAEDWTADDDAGQDRDGRPRFRPVRHRADRWSERWVPEPLRTSRRLLSGRSAVLLTVVGVVAVLVAGWGWWSGRAEPTPVAEAGSAVQVVQGAATASSTAATDQAPAAVAPAPEGVASVAVTPAEAAQIWVSVTGRVVSPGLYPLPGGSRVADALTAAGGLVDQADLTGINLAQTLTDGQSVVVAEAGTQIQPAAGATAAPVGGGGQGAVLDLNAADQAALENLPGVGPVMAQAILQWRTDNGPFTSVEQLQEVSGIGPARYAQLAPLVSV